MEEKVGRNDPCSCGSGKKYKNCCLSKDLVAEKSLLGKRKITARVVSAESAERLHEQVSEEKVVEQQSARKMMVDYATLMERSFGESMHEHEDKPPVPLDPTMYLDPESRK
jgi:uncharacterized protein